jgi:hypothetical protein
MLFQLFIDNLVLCGMFDGLGVTCGIGWAKPAAPIS